MSCFNSRNAEMFSKPRDYDGFQVYGVCLKDMGRDGQHNAYPIYVPGGEACKSKIPINQDSRQVQMTLPKEAL